MDTGCAKADSNCEGELRDTAQGTLCGWHAVTSPKRRFICASCNGEFATRGEMQEHWRQIGIR